MEKAGPDGKGRSTSKDTDKVVAMLVELHVMPLSPPHVLSSAP